MQVLHWSVLAVGTEVTDGQILNRNSAWLSARLTELGAEVIEHRTVPDDRAAIVSALHDLAKVTDAIVVTGGLGPTSDDFTRECIASFASVPLEWHEPSFAKIQARLERRGVAMSENQRQQCYFPAGAEILENPAGTANGFLLQVGATLVVVLPGPPLEVETIWRGGLSERIRAGVPAASRRLTLLRAKGIGEGLLGQAIEPILDAATKRLGVPRPTIGYRAHAPFVEIKLWTNEIQAITQTVIDEIAAEIKVWLGPRLVAETASRFPHADPIDMGPYGAAGTTHSASEVLKHLVPRLTEDRWRKIQSVVSRRTCDVVPVLENIYDRGNTSAVFRSAEAMGFQLVHVIEPGERFKEANRVTAGADKWLDVQRYKTTAASMAALKASGYQILATHLDPKAKPLAECDLRRPTAIVFGNEKDGISAEMIAGCDQTVVLPMRGFVQSYNISVAAAIAFQTIISARADQASELTETERRILEAHYCLRTLDNPGRLLAHLTQR